MIKKSTESTNMTFKKIKKNTFIHQRIHGTDDSCSIHRKESPPIHSMKWQPFMFLLKVKLFGRKDEVNSEFSHKSKASVSFQNSKPSN